MNRSSTQSGKSVIDFILWCFLILVGLMLCSMYLSRMPETHARDRMNQAKKSMERIFKDLNQINPVTPQFLVPSEKQQQLIEKVGGNDYSFIMAYEEPSAKNPILDPNSPKKSLPFAFYEVDGNWMLISPGTDKVFGEHPKAWFTAEMDASAEPLRLRSYDATNGIFSAGDVFLVRPKQEAQKPTIDSPHPLSSEQANN